MSVSLKLVLGTVNYTDFLRVSAAKVSDPNTEVFVEYIDVPVTNYVLIIPELDPDNYYINFRDAPDEVSLGTLVSQAFVNALTGEWEYERRFYTIGALPDGASNTDQVLTDQYLENKNVTGVFKEGFRYLKLDDEATHDDSAGTVTLSGDHIFSAGEVFAVEIKYNVGTSSGASSTSIFSGTITVTDASYTVSVSDKGKRFCLDAAGVVQLVTLPALSGLADGDYFYFEHKRNGVQAQSKIVTSGSNKILFNGLNHSTNELSELWLSKGQTLYLRKTVISSVSYYEVIFDYAGSRVGERMSGTWRSHPNFLPEDGSLRDGDEYPALWWWINNILDATHVITDDTVVSGGYAHPAGKHGLFVKHSTLKKFRLPNTQGWNERGLADFDSYGSDGTRDYDYPGGTQAGQVGEFSVTIPVPKGHSYSGSPNTLRFSNGNNSPENINWPLTFNAGEENTVKNIGVIFLRHI